MVYVDNGIFLGSNNLQLKEVIKEIQDLDLNIEDQGHPMDYIGDNIKKLKMAYPQAPIEMDIYMELPQWIQTKHGDSNECILTLEKNIYGQK